jgi:Cft2 family RNA processing exonuclease
LPLLVKRGFTGPVFCSESTAEFCRILLPDSGYLQEKDALREPARVLSTAGAAALHIRRRRHRH